MRGRGWNVGKGLAFVTAACVLAVVACSSSTPSCGPGQCLGTDNTCYGPCSVGSCTTSPSGNCSQSNGGVYCCTADPCSGCQTSNMECCPNRDGVYDCAPVGAACCGNHRWCPSGYVCGGTCGSECCR